MIARIIGIFEIFQGLGLVDGAFNTALSLEYLGEADINESVLADQHRPEGLLTPRAVLSEDDWARGVFVPELEATLSELLGLLARPALEQRRASAKKSGVAPSFDERDRQDVAASTATLVRALSWATRVLGVEVPALYLRAEVDGAIQPVLAESPALVASRSLGSGLDLPELAFLWGRSLFALRKEHRLALAFDTPEALGELFEAARGAVTKGGKAPLAREPGADEGAREGVRRRGAGAGQGAARGVARLEDERRGGAREFRARRRASGASGLGRPWERGAAQRALPLRSPAEPLGADRRAARVQRERRLPRAAAPSRRRGRLVVQSPRR